MRDIKPRRYKDLTDGPVITDPGNSVLFQTGSWRSMRPVRVETNCVNCLQCWIYCPDMAVKTNEEQMAGFDYRYCKGCGICEQECRGRKGNKAIRMKKEKK